MKRLDLIILLTVVINCFTNDVKTEEVSQNCLQCICKASSGCKLNTKCHNSGPNAYFCGPYQISWAYWSDAGKPGDTGASDAFEHCLTDKNCAEVAVRGYMTKWRKDCNNDGVIDCLDFAAIHKAGANSCDQQWLYNSQYWNVFRQCQISGSDASTQPVLNDEPWIASQPQTHPKPQAYRPQSQPQPQPQNPPQPIDPWDQPLPQPQPIKPWNQPSPQPQPYPNEPYNNPQPVADDAWNQPQPPPNPSFKPQTIPYAPSQSRPPLKPQSQPYPNEPYNQPQPKPDELWNEPQPQPQSQPSLKPQSQPLPDESWNQPQPQPRPSFSPQPYNPTQPIGSDPWNQPPSQPRPSLVPQPFPYPNEDYNPQPSSSDDPWDEVSRAVDELSRPSLKPQIQVQPTPTDPWNSNQPQSQPLVIPGRAPTQPVSWSSQPNPNPSNFNEQPVVRPVADPNQAIRNLQPSSPLIELSIGPSNGSVEQNCLECICQASSDCDLNKQCQGAYCGPYLISWAYWSDGGQPGGDYVTCANNKGCSEHAVQGYMNKWQRDCSGDGIIDCTDFAAIHKLGPHSCSSEAIHGTDYWTSYQSCKSPSIDARRIESNPSGDSITGRSVPQSLPIVNLFNEYPKPVEPKPQPVTRDAPIVFPKEDSNIPQPNGYSDLSPGPVHSPPNVNNVSNGRAFEELGLQRECLDCICQASSKCNADIGCQNDGSGGYVCGPYQMNWAYWSDAGKPGIRGNLENLENFQSCLNNKDCAEAAVYAYLKKWKRDCNEDRVINCYDFAALHRTGPSNCNAQWFLESQYWSDFRECFDFRRRK